MKESILTTPAASARDIPSQDAAPLLCGWRKSLPQPASKAAPSERCPRAEEAIAATVNSFHQHLRFDMERQKIFKFQEIVDRGRLRAPLAKYILAHPQWLAGMPANPDNGGCRRFTSSQAVRLAICSHLLGTGTPLEYAGEIVDRCEAFVMRNSNQGKIRGRIYGAPAADPWVLEVLDCYLFRAWRNELSELRDDDTFLDFRRGMEETAGGGSELNRVEINLTVIEQRFF
jgi:hypothetical protein